jgi:hypothetical protein
MVRVLISEIPVIRTYHCRCPRGEIEPYTVLTPIHIVPNAGNHPIDDEQSLMQTVSGMDAVHATIDDETGNRMKQRFIDDGRVGECSQSL